jgi:hypothetical protein
VTGTPAPADPSSGAALDLQRLRAEHDDLAKQLVRRTSIDEARKAVYAGFAGLIAAGLAVRLAFDRWLGARPVAAEGLPVLFLLALAAALVLLPLALRWTVRSRREMRREDALWARFQAVRDQLGFDR